MTVAASTTAPPIELLGMPIIIWVPILTLLVTILGWFVVAYIGLHKERRLVREQKRQEAYESAYQFVVGLGNREFKEGPDVLLLAQHQANLQAYGSLKVVRSINDLVKGFTELANSFQTTSEKNSTAAFFDLGKARVELVNAIRKENGLRSLKEKDLIILSSRPVG